MPPKFFWRGSILLLSSLFCLLIISPIASSAPVQAYTQVAATPTPDVNSVLEQANNAASKADQQVAQAQNFLNLMNTYAAILGLVLAFFGVVTIGLGIFGFSTNNGFRDLEKEWRQRLDSVAALQDEMEEKRKVIGDLQQEMEEKRTTIADLDHTVLHFAERQTEAVKHFEDTNKALSYLVLGNQLLELKKNKEAIEAYEKARKLLPHDPEMHYILGRIYSNIGYYSEAFRSLEAALAARPTFAEAEMEIGLTYRLRGDQVGRSTAADAQERRKADYALATSHLQSAIKLRENYTDALATLGGLYRRLGDYEQALEYYKQAVDTAPESSYPLGNVASITWFLGKTTDAISYFKRTETAATQLLRTRPSGELYWNYYDLALAQLVLSSAEKNETRLQEALQTYRTAIRLTPRSVVLDGALSNLSLLQRAKEPITGIQDVITLIEIAKTHMGQKVLNPY